MLLCLPRGGLGTLTLQVNLGLGVTTTNGQALHVLGSFHQKHLMHDQDWESNTEAPRDTQTISWNGPIRSPQWPSETWKYRVVPFWVTRYFYDLRKECDLRDLFCVFWGFLRGGEQPVPKISEILILQQALNEDWIAQSANIINKKAKTLKDTRQLLNW